MIGAMSRRHIRTLYVEDDPEDVELFRMAAQRCDGTLELHVVQDGESASEYFRSVESGETARPEIVLLDLNLPRKDGITLLKEIKESEFKATPVMILSSSSAERDVNAAYSNGASIYLEKPNAMEDLCEMVGLIGRLWAVFARLPPPEA